MPLIDNPDRALRLARAIVSDIVAYNADKIVHGLEDDNIFDVLKDELEEGRAHYRAQTDPSLYERTNFYDRAIVDVLVARHGHVKSRIW